MTISLIQRAAFDAETTRIMGEAFDRVCEDMHDAGQPDIVLKVVAKRITEIAQTGKHDPAQIAKLALEAVGLRRTGQGLLSGSFLAETAAAEPTAAHIEYRL